MARFAYQDTFGNGSDLTAYIDENSLNPEVFLTDEFILRDANDAGVTFVGSGFTYGSGGIPSDGMVTFFFAFDDTGAPLLTVSDFSLNLGTLAMTYLRDGLDAVGVDLSAGRDTFQDRSTTTRSTQARGGTGSLAGRARIRSMASAATTSSVAMAGRITLSFVRERAPTRSWISEIWAALWTTGSSCGRQIST